MTLISETTGHSARQERHVANILYICILAAVVVGLALAFSFSRHRQMNPFTSGEPAKTSPDTPGTNRQPLGQ